MEIMIMFLFIIPSCMIASAVTDIISGDYDINVSAILSVFAAIAIFIIAVNLKGTPTAMDVYRDKTTLEITYKDGVAIDTVVVFKK